MTIRQMTCCVCGEYAGRWQQHWNQDNGFGVCMKCITWLRSRGQSETEILDLYGKEGVNWGITPDLDAKPIVRQFSPCGPCLRLGKLYKETAQFYIFLEWQGGDTYQGQKRVRKRTAEHYSGAHIEPCRSCRDHAQTQYPQGYMD